MNWQEYEDEVFRELQQRYPGAPMKHNATVLGRLSENPRQIDILRRSITWASGHIRDVFD
jgi:hypothetical protein